MNPSASSVSRWKVQELEACINDKIEDKLSVPLIALTETWLSPHIADAQVHLSGYDLVRSDRMSRKGGGVLLYVKDDFPISDFDTYDDGTCQALSCTLTTLKLIIFVIYRPPNADLISFNEVINFVSSRMDSMPHNFQTIVCGDFNFPHIDWKLGEVVGGMSQHASASAHRLIDFQNSNMLSQYVQCPTRGSNILDLFFTSNPFLVVNSSAESSSMSDHNLVELILVLNTGPIHAATESNDETGFQGLDFSKADFNVLNESFSKINWAETLQYVSLDDMPVVFTNSLLSVCKRIVPKRQPKRGKPRLVQTLRRKRRKLKKRIEYLMAIQGNIEHVQQLRRKVHLITYDIGQAVLKDLDLREIRIIGKIKDNPKAFYGYAKKHSSVRNEITTLSTPGGYVTDKESIANLFQDQFSSVFSDPNSPKIEQPDFPTPFIPFPIGDAWAEIHDDDVLDALAELKPSSSPGPDGVPSILLKRCSSTLVYPIKFLLLKSIEESFVPSFYKSTHICPLFKKGDRAKAENFRPISKTSHVIKTHERIMRKKLVNYFEQNLLFSLNQHGFRSKRSTLTQLLQHFDAINEGLVNNMDTDSIYLDYEKAFDKVDHNLLLAKLKRYKLPALFVDWISSFLRNRTQTVVVGGMQSRPQCVVSGVPQGSVLGPALFLVFVNDIERSLTSSTIGFFADDTRISSKISTCIDMQALQTDLNSVLAWSEKNNMRLHSRKFELMVHRANPIGLASELPFESSIFSYQLPDNLTLYETSDLRDLGVLVSTSGSWTNHINLIVEKAKGVSSWVCSVFKSRQEEVMVTLYKSIVRSHLEYCCPVWNPHKIADIKKLEDVQKQFTSKIAGLQDLNYYERLSALNLMSLQRRRERYILIHMWKILYGEVPPLSSFKFNEPSRLGIQAELPPLRRGTRQAIQTRYDESFAMTGPVLWNVLPAHLHTISKFESFKTALTKFLMSIPDRPPVSGYPSSGSNSIVERRTGGSRLGL